VVFLLSTKFMRRHECEEIRKNCGEIHNDMKEHKNKHEKRMDEAANERVRLNDLLQRLPTADNIHALTVNITKLEGQIKALETQVHGQAEILKIVRQQAERMNAYLMTRGCGVSGVNG